MKLVTYTGRYPSVTVDRYTFKRNEPTPVPERVAQLLKSKPNFSVPDDRPRPVAPAPQPEPVSPVADSDEGGIQ